MIPRIAESTLRRLAKGFPVICITGPRQSGKTTLARKAFPDKPYISLEDPDIARLAREDPRPGRYVVTGSQQFNLLAGVTESLAEELLF